MTLEEFLSIAAINVISFLGGGFLHSYLQKKGANLADKEDIANLTQQIENVKRKINIEQHRTNIFNEKKLIAITEIYAKLIDMAELLRNFYVRFDFCTSYQKNIDYMDEYFNKVKSSSQDFFIILNSINKNLIFLEDDISNKTIDILPTFKDIMFPKENLPEIYRKILNRHGIINMNYGFLPNEVIKDFENAVKTINRKLDEATVNIYNLIGKLQAEFKKALIG